ncbi:MAG: hypothetical protein ACM3JD_14710 [Rudaea sp.]
MLPVLESFLDAAPEKGVIIVEYYWQPALAGRPPAEPGAGVRSSVVFFKRLLTTGRCWCGSRRAFGRCHRRRDDWSYVTLDPDQRAFGPVVLIDRRFAHPEPAGLRKCLEEDRLLLPIDGGGTRQVWGIAAHPPVKNELGQLLLGTLALGRDELVLETNGEKRLDYLSEWMQAQFGDGLRAGQTRRMEPQQAFAPPVRRKR